MGPSNALIPAELYRQFIDNLPLVCVDILVRRGAHIKDPKAALQAFRRSCVGTLIASVPNEDRYPFKAETFARDESPHFRHYRPEEFDELLKDCGFKVSERFCQQDKKGDIHSGTDGMFIIYVCE